MDNLDPIDIVGQEKRQAEMAKDRKNLRNGQIEDFKWLMSDKRGRRFIWRLLEMTGVYRTSFTGNSTTFFNEGQRNIGLMVVNEVHSNCPELYETLIKENSNND
jgi:hypothetical protein